MSLNITFISSSRKGKGISPFIKKQGESIQKCGLRLNYFTIEGSGVLSYVKSIFKFRKYLFNNKTDIIHAHYNLCGIVALFANLLNKHKIIVSFMGDDLYGTFGPNSTLSIIGKINIFLSRTFMKYYSAIIVKSEKMTKIIPSQYKAKCFIVPNGVDLNQFVIIDKEIAKNKLGLSSNNPYVLYLNNKLDIRKNYKLFCESLNHLHINFNILCPYPLDHNIVPLYLSAADVLVQVSKMEGSSNLIKEAMATNCPIVTTDVGDSKYVIGRTEGCYISNFDSKEVAAKINLALEYSLKTGRTKGRNRISDLGLDSSEIANKIICIYNKVLFDEL